MNQPSQLRAMIGSTAADLPEHRKQVVEACLRESVFPIGMEQLPARDAGSIQTSLEMVDQADIYIGIFAWRYGWVPQGSDISITEMELNRAVERKARGELKDILVFLMHENHPVMPRDVEADASAQDKLAKLKNRAVSGRVRKEFRSADDLRGLVVQALADVKRRLERAAGGPPAPSFHPPSNIPAAPARYVAHPYTLLQTVNVVGRREELKLVTDWVTKNEQVPKDTRVFCVVAIGGMGKSALSWKWFEEIAPNELPNLAGRMWWSFYESDAHFENFVIRALAYTAGLPEAEVRALPSPERDHRLLRLLDEHPFLLVLDGLERILLAYSRMDAAHLVDDDLDEQTANAIADAHGLPIDVKETYLERHRLRQCTDPRAGAFLGRLARVRSSRILVSTRLYPTELQTQTAAPLPGCHPLFLRGLTDDDALVLWRAFIGSERSGTTEQLLPLFRTFDNYPLLLRALAGEVATYRPAPGDFDRWRREHPSFDPAGLPLKNARTHVLEFALRGLGDVQRRVLFTLAAFRMPGTWDILSTLLVGHDKPCADEKALDAVLTELEDRGLVGWDKRANRYDLHPIVRGVVWAVLDPSVKRDISGSLHVFFEATMQLKGDRIETLEDLTPAVELFDKLVNLERYDEALAVFRDHIQEVMHYRLSASRLGVELLQRLFPNGLAAPPCVHSPQDQGYALNVFAIALLGSGEPSQAAVLFRRAAEISEGANDVADLPHFLLNLAEALWRTGHLREAEGVAYRAVATSREQGDRFGEAASLRLAGLALAARGEGEQSYAAHRRALAIDAKYKQRTLECVDLSFLCQCHLWLGQPLG